MCVPVRVYTSCMYVRLSVCLSVCLSACLFVSLYVGRSRDLLVVSAHAWSVNLHQASSYTDTEMMFMRMRRTGQPV
jgi:hypothetical protein